VVVIARDDDDDAINDNDEGGERARSGVRDVLLSDFALSLFIMNILTINIIIREILQLMRNMIHQLTMLTILNLLK